MCDFSDVLNTPIKEKKRKRDSESDREDEYSEIWGVYGGEDGKGTTHIPPFRSSSDMYDWGAQAATLIDAATKGQDRLPHEVLTLQRYALYSSKYKETPYLAAKTLGLPLAEILRWNKETYKGLEANSQLLKGTTLEILPDYQPLGALSKAASFIWMGIGGKPFTCPVMNCQKSYTHQRTCLVHEKSMCVNIRKCAKC